jgi:predicted DNA-binding WGR domain protein
MSNRRAAGQKLVNFPIKEDYLEFVDDQLPGMGYTERAQFIRDAIREKIEATIGIKVDNDLVLPPGRVGKGGARKIDSYRADERQQKRRANSVADDASRAAAERAAAAARKRRSK